MGDRVPVLLQSVFEIVKVNQSTIDLPPALVYAPLPYKQQNTTSATFISKIISRELVSEPLA
jgi:hypothetical protein